jgi:hypothetical protein
MLYVYEGWSGSAIMCVADLGQEMTDTDISITGKLVPMLN